MGFMLNLEVNKFKAKSYVQKKIQTFPENILLESNKQHF